MKFIGAHVSIAGGVENAPVNAKSINATAFAMFTKNQRQWKASPFTEESKTLLFVESRNSGSNWSGSKPLRSDNEDSSDFIPPKLKFSISIGSSNVFVLVLSKLLNTMPSMVARMLSEDSIPYSTSYERMLV